MSAPTLRVWKGLGFLCGGLLVWAGLFLLSYIVTAVSCARHAADTLWLGIGVLPAALVLVAAGALGGLHAIARRANRLQEPGARRSDDTRRVVEHEAHIVCGLALIAIVWNTLPVLLTVSRC
jgi:hypothetical protein